MGMSLGNLIIKGTVLKGFDDQSPEERVALQEFPGIDGVGEISLGLRGRPIIVPMCLHPYTLSELNALRGSLLELQRTGQEFAAAVQNALQTFGYPHCKLRAVVKRSDVLPDVAGTVGGGVFVHWDFLLYQLKV
jgi:hypothetical protein